MPILSRTSQSMQSSSNLACASDEASPVNFMSVATNYDNTNSPDDLVESTSIKNSTNVIKKVPRYRNNRGQKPRKSRIDLEKVEDNTHNLKMINNTKIFNTPMGKKARKNTKAPAPVGAKPATKVGARMSAMLDDSDNDEMTGLDLDSYMEQIMKVLKEVTVEKPQKASHAANTNPITKHDSGDNEHISAPPDVQESEKKQKATKKTGKKDVNVEKLKQLKKVIDTLLVNEIQQIARTNQTDTVEQLEHNLTEKIDQIDKADRLNQIPINRTFVARKKDKKNGFGNEQYLKTYNEIVKGHDVQVKVTQTFVRAFLKEIVNDIKLYEKEKLPKAINIDQIVKNIADSLPKTIDQDEFYLYVSEYLVAKSSQHYYYDMMASRIAMKRLHNTTTPDFLVTAQLLQENLDKNNDRSPILADEIFDIITRHHVRLQEAIKYERDYLFDYFGIKTLERSYLYKLHFTKFKIIERPQHMIMRVALGIHGEDIDSAIETYDLISQKFFTHATPTLFNAGTRRAQMSSCFLQAIDDNIESIFEAIKDIAFTSKWSGGIGVHLSALRCRGSLIRGTNGLASGIIPLCVLLNKLAKYINQGGKRNGSIACYLETHHADIFDFCDLRKNTGNDDNRARDLYLALWVSSLFMKRVKEDGMWSLMCPDECPGLNQVHGEEYVKLYERYEEEKRYVKQVKARDLWKHILESQSETGFPYIVYKDNANAKSNQKNLGTIRSSNLCAEIIQYSDENETAVCNLASICLPMYIETDAKGQKTYNHEKLIRVCRVIVRNLDKIIDRNYYPTEKTKRSNMRHRPMGIGVQGLADVYNIMGFSYASKEAFDLNKRIFETIYYACLDESKELAKRFGPYSTFKGSPASQGQFQFHMWGESEDNLLMGYDWKKLIQEVMQYGLRNSLLTALMPTASTSQIMGNSECIEPYMSNIFKRSTLAGEFIVVNKNLMKDLIALDLWDDDMRKRLIIENGSVKKLDMIPAHLRDVYETAFEIQQMHLVRQSADRGKMVDQAQSFNLFLAEPDFDILTSALFDGHDLGNKTGMYYYRSLPAINPINFGIDVEDIKRLTGRDATVEMISGSYNIDEVRDKDKAEKKRNGSKAMSKGNSKEKKTTDTKVVAKKKVKDGNDDKPDPVYCKWKPGVKLDDCASCGA